jgi:uncharacterized protein YuzE
MQITYDAEVDALSIIFHETTVTTEELADGITAEYDSQGQLVGFEILGAAQQFSDKQSLEQILALRPSPRLQERTNDLLSRSKHGQLSHQKETELERYLLLEHLVRLAKVYAYKQQTP